jgi:adenylate kinase family enzyme
VQRVLVAGSSGAGKSTLAAELAVLRFRSPAEVRRWLAAG